MRKRGQPWFLYVAFQTPHFPLQTLPEDAASYDDVYAAGWDKIREQRLMRQKTMGLMGNATALTPRSRIPKPEIAKRMGSLTEDSRNPPWDTLGDERRADLARRMAVFAGMVTGMDRNIGRIVASLREHDDIEDTLILFLSDNGACAEWEPFGFDLDRPVPGSPGTGINMGTQAAANVLHRGPTLKDVGGPDTFISYGSGWANAGNAPFGLYKHYSHEGGIRTPFIAHWPQMIQDKGGLRHEPGHLIDIMPTLVDVAGAEYPIGRGILPMEGISLVPVLQGRPSGRTGPLFFEHERSRAVREGKWKLVSAADGDWELYDMDADPTEMHSLAAGMPERVAAMSSKWQAWAERAHVLPMIGERGRPAKGKRPK